MGTNYYLIKNACPHCGATEEAIHIGKSSAGWYFALNTDVYSYEQWMEIFEIIGSSFDRIQNDSGTAVTGNAMIANMHDRSIAKTNRPMRRGEDPRRIELNQDIEIGINHLCYVKHNKIHPLYPIQYVKGEFS